jgi:hypothetical protein
MTKKNSKLSLTREAIRRLADVPRDQLVKVAGGVSLTCVTHSCPPA